MVTERRSLVCPALFEVSGEAIELLRSERQVDDHLVEFWKTQGSGFFDRDESGEIINDMITNELIQPEQILEMLQDETGDFDDLLKIGLPFFNTLDREFLAIAPTGEIVDLNASEGRRVISKTFGEFIEALMENPTFYEDGLPTYQA